MTQNKLIAPSILSADFGRLRDEVRAVEAAGADIIHVDVMDGHFVPNITIGPCVVEAVRKATKLPIDCHLMIEHPENFVEAFIKAGADYVSVHVEDGYHLDRTLNLIRSLGTKAGVAINPATPIQDVFPVLDVVDYVLVMTVNPGFGNQKFIPYCTHKIKALSDEIKKQKKQVLIEIDGGVKQDNIAQLSDCGTNIFVAGSAIFQSKDYKKTIQDMKKSINAS
jgi:ribulose-phosphate 3-epimerase